LPFNSIMTQNTPQMIISDHNTLDMQSEAGRVGLFEFRSKWPAW
jgi:hypothetical protein